MATSIQSTLCGSLVQEKAIRMSYTREFKLSAVSKYRETNNLYATCKLFGLNTKTLGRWITNESKKSRKGSKHVQHSRQGRYPDMEVRLHEEYKELRAKGLKVKGYWFKVRARQLMEEICPGKPFAFSDGWFAAFKERYSISFRQVTNQCQRPASDKR